MSNPYPTGFQSENPEAQSSDRSLFDCFGKKEEEDDIPMTEAQQKSSEKLQRSSSGSSSSSEEEEVEEGGEKIRRPKKKGLADRIKEKLPGHKNEGETTNAEETHHDEKKGFLEKIKEKMPGHHKDEAVIVPHPIPSPAPVPAPPHCQSDGHGGEERGVHHEQQEKKGIFEKIKEKMPGHHKDEAVIVPHSTPSPDPVLAPPHCQSDGHSRAEHGIHEQQEKKGIFEKIKEKLPGGHKDGDDAKKD